MAKFNLHISDGVEAEVTIDVDNAHEAVNDGLNALTNFALRHFPPPENVSITISDAERMPVATLKLSFEIQYAARVLS